MEIDREEIVRVFSLEAKEQLDTIEGALLELEQRPDDPELLNVMFRAAHTLKGNAGVVQLTSIEAFTHSLEDVLERVKTGVIPATSDLVSVLLRAIDGLRRIIPLALDGVDDPQPEHEALLGWLEARRYGAGRVASRSSEPPPQPAVAQDDQRTLRVDVDKLDRMLNLVGEITIARGRLGNLLRAASSASLEELRGAHHDADRLFLELQEQLMRARMVPLGPTFRRYLRVVRDLALERGKEARLVIEGEDVEVDTAVVEGIKDPLTHMIRNAVDHGLETAAARLAAGKDGRGTIELGARHEAGSILITMRDDGGGLSRERILRRARAMKIVGEDEQPSDEALFEMIFVPGFSTAAEITEISGRGIGMNVVRQNIEALRGSVSVESELGRGTTITLRLPLTLAIIEGFSVAVGEETYVLPLESVVECVDLPSEERRREVAQGVIDLRGQPLPYLRLARLLDLPSDPAARESLVVLQHRGARAGIAVDGLRGAGQTVIKPLASLVDHAPTVAGCALLGSGRVALVLDVPALFGAATGAST